MKSPFKFLDAFTLSDKDAFFGRDQEIETQYSIAFKTPMLLVYGMSGTGKTSLVQCGLASRFDGPDWYPIFFRRNENINTSVSAIMRHELGEDTKEKLVDNVALLVRKKLRPVYLLFDQFEELFILGKEEEQQEFMNSIHDLLEANLAAKIILIMREEYIGQLYHFENLIPELFNHRFRVETMGPAKVKGVIQSSFDKFNIHLAEPKEELLDLMVKNISDPRAGVTLPYLQVYLDMLYRDKFRKQYGAGDPEGYPQIDISKADINSLGQIDNVLERFLDDQTRELNIELRSKHKNLKPNIIQSVLDIFVSEEGTKRPISYKQEGDDIVLTDPTINALSEIPGPLLSEILSALQTDRILRRGDEFFELAHDSLASVIDSRRSESQRRLQNIRKRLDHAFEEYQKTGAILNQKQLASFDEFIPSLGLSAEMEQFLEKCEIEIKRKATEEQDRLQQESKIAHQKKLARTRGIFLTIAVVLATLAVIMAFKSSKRAAELAIQGEALKKEIAFSKYNQDSITNIILQVDQQFGRMDSILWGRLPQSELVKTLITLKSLVRNDTIDQAVMKAKYISVINLFTSKGNFENPAYAEADTVFREAKVHVVMHLKTPQPREWIQIKWLTSDGKIMGEPTYMEVTADPSTNTWVTVFTMFKTPGSYRVELYNSQGIEMGRKNFRIAEVSNTAISMTETSEFFTMKSGNINPGPKTNTFKTGQPIYYWFRINNPKEEGLVYVKLTDSNQKEIWNDQHTVLFNTDKGYRGWKYHNARAPGKYYIALITKNGLELAGHYIEVTSNATNQPPPVAPQNSPNRDSIPD